MVLLRKKVRDAGAEMVLLNPAAADIAENREQVKRLKPRSCRSLS